jgi:murein DD-endopeptidase MepM/ murein hydrolase activator NlpD
MGDNIEGMTALLSDFQTRYGTAWNPRKADQEFTNALSQIHSTDARKQFRTEYQSIRRTQDALSNSIAAGPVDKAVAETVKATLIAKYPDQQEAALSQNWKAIDDAIYGRTKTNAAAAAAKLSGAFRAEVYAKLGDAMAKKGGKLSNLEQQNIIQDTLKNYETNHKSTFGSLLPGIGSTPSINPSTPSVADPSKPAAPVPAGTKVQTAPRFSVSGLDNIPDREKRLTGGGAVLDYKSTTDVIQAALNNEPLPAALKRAAKDASMTPEAFILKQADAYPDNITVPPEVRRELMQRGNRRKALEDHEKSISRMPSQADAIATATRWLGNSLLGIAPASAATRYEAPGYMQQQRQQSGGWTARDNRGQSVIAMAGRLGVNPADLAAIFSYETGGTLNPSEPGRGAAAGRIGLIQAGPNERMAYGLGTGNWELEIKGVERYLKDRGVKPGMKLPDLYAAVNGGNVGAGYTADGNGVVPRNASTQRELQRHRDQAMAKLGLTQDSSYGLPVNAGLQQFARAKPVTPSMISSQFGNHESFRKHAHEGADVGLTAGSRIGFKVGGTVLDVARTNSRDGEANGGYGNYMDVRLDNGQVVRMAHLKEIPAGLARGAKFGANQIIARSGGRRGDAGAGRSTGDHLHFEEHSIRQGLKETTRGKLNPNRPGGSLSYLMWE